MGRSNVMTQMDMAAIILAAGAGTRMKSETPKVLHEIAGRSMLAHVLARTAELDVSHEILVVGSNAENIEIAAKKERANIQIAVQSPPRGTGDAVAKAAPALGDFSGVVLVMYADTPLVTAENLGALAHSVESGAAIAVLGFSTEDPGAYGRLKLDSDGDLVAIVEAKDAGPEELAIDFVNSGVMAIDADFLRRGLPKLNNDNAKKEYYLTDLVAIANQTGKRCAVVEADEDEVVGVNSRIELAVAEEIYQDNRRLEMMASGVTLIDPSSVFFAYDTKIECDVTVEPNVFFGPGVKVASGARIRANSHIEGAHIGRDALIGPFARLRPGAMIGADAKIGNFVEIKNATLGEDAKVSHLSYVGDAEVGDSANIGAGVITCNFDGFDKHTTKIGADAFVGSNSALVAPVTIEEGAYIGSGSVITRNVERDALSVARERQKDFPGWAKKYRESKGKKK